MADEFYQILLSSTYSPGTVIAYQLQIFPLKKGENGSNIESLVQTILKFNQENSISFKAWE